MIEEYNLLQILEPLFEILFLPFLFWDNSGMILGQSWDNYNQIIPSLWLICGSLLGTLDEVEFLKDHPTL